ncbi:hypothetical protein AJ80_03337 [Polytolypa hystricis UAMH7299]|uniref:aldehyde dehydrogenase (NAD(+)) n=1 Tax=Polytolypa hystricis (strain UAMH7299) TaxID=1447883 RepID=A0A2B7YL06_POLH7|nr:hypothetical protein AJ80_03337 [Polytolypa hystricis UAMH7299]
MAPPPSPPPSWLSTMAPSTAFGSSEVYPQPSPSEIETRLFINNEFVTSIGGRKFDVINPATEEVTASVYEAEIPDVDRAVQAAADAFPAWSALGAFQRAECFYRLAELYEQSNTELARLEAVSMGKPVGKYTEGTACARFLRYMAGKAADVQGESSLQTAGYVNVSFRQPYGVCAAIAPWNAPVTALTFKLAPAVLAGNTLVAKSSEKAPLTSLFLARLILRAGFPPGVINILSGTGPLCGAALASHMGIRKLSFTGSVGAGREIKKAAAASNLKNVTLELGGKSPMIVFNDADVQHAAVLSARSTLYNSGQVCTSSSRVYVHASIADDFCRRLVTALEELGANPPLRSTPEAPGNSAIARLGNPLAKSTVRGPQADKAQFDTIMGYLHGARESGYTILTGGDREVLSSGRTGEDAHSSTGFFIQPTVIFNPPSSSAVMQEEIFGPVVCVAPFESEEEVLRLANDTEYGLYASVFTRDISRALRFVKGLESGAVGVNCTSPFMTHDMPFGGIKQSGEGRELGKRALDEWTEEKSVFIAL